MKTEQANCMELSELEAIETNGGIPILVALEIYAGLCAIAYGGGALYGLLTK